MIIFSKGHQGLASKEPLEYQEQKEVKASEDPQERAQWGFPGPLAVLVHQALQGCQDLQDHQVKMPFCVRCPVTEICPSGAMNLTRGLAISVDHRSYVSTGVSFINSLWKQLRWQGYFVSAARC